MTEQHVQKAHHDVLSTGLNPIRASQGATDQRTVGHVPAKVRLNDTDHPFGPQYRAQLRVSVTLAAENWRTVPARPGELGRAQAATRDLLRDPESACFEGLFAVESSAASRYVCAQVNARNGYGGYAGRWPFGFDPMLGVATLIEDPRCSVASSITRD